MQSVESHIEKSIKSKPKGSLVLPSDFIQYGTAKAVQKSLERLEDKGIIIRVAQGIYVRPKISKLIGPLTPSAEEVAEAIAKRDRIRTVPTGSYALNALGLSPQVPMNIVFQVFFIFLSEQIQYFLFFFCRYFSITYFL